MSENPNSLRPADPPTGRAYDGVVPSGVIPLPPLPPIIVPPEDPVTGNKK